MSAVRLGRQGVIPLARVVRESGTHLLGLAHHLEELLKKIKNYEN